MSLPVDKPSQIEVTVTYRYTPVAANYATEDNTDPTLEEMMEMDDESLNDPDSDLLLSEFIDWDLADVSFKIVTERP